MEKRIPILVIAAILILLIIGAAAVFYQSQKDQARETVTRDLASISTLKAEQIASWREERLQDARRTSQNPFFIEGVDAYLSSPSPGDEEKILAMMHEINTSAHYHNVLLVDPGANVRISLDPGISTVYPGVFEGMEEAFASGDAVLTGLHLLPGTDTPHMDVIAPLVLQNGEDRIDVGAIVLSIDPEAFLYPYVQSWPVPSRSAETLIVERQGDRVLFLNDLRHQEHTALHFSIPLTETDVPAVIAVSGTTGIFEGRDYRGVDVISFIRPVPDSPWFIVTKVDTEEAFSSWAAQSAMILAIGAALLAGVLVSTAWIRQREQRVHYQSLYRMEAEKSRVEQLSRERMEALLHLAGMETATEQELADFVMDAACRLTDSSLAFIGKMSPDESVFCLTAWSRSVLAECAVAKDPLHFPVAWAGIWAEAVRQRKPIVVNDYAAPLPGKKGLPEGHVPIHRFVSVPIFEGNRIVMICAVANKETEYVPLDVDQLVLLVQGAWRHLQRRVAAEALRESEERYREFFTTSRDSVFITTPDGRWIDFNDASLEIFGFASREELMTLPLPELYEHQEERAALLALIEKEGYVREYPVRLRKKDRTVIDTLITAVPVRESDGSVRAYIGSIRDITERKLAQKALRESEERFRSYFEGSTTGIFISDSQGRFRGVNPTACRWMRYSREELLGLSIPDILDDSSRRTAMDKFRELVETGKTTTEAVFVRKDGTRFMMVVDAVRIRADEYIAFCQDVTARRAAEEEREELIRQLEQKNAELERFTYTVSHDLKSPLITIRGFAGLLEKDLLRGDIERTTTDISRINAAVDRMQHLLTDLLNLSRIGRLINPPEDIELGTIASEAVELLAGPIREHGVHVGIAPGLPTVHVDHARILEVYTNLIENAIRFTMGQENPVIEIGMREEEGERVFFVRDNGIGIEPRYLTKIFGLFEKLDGRSEGTGIGLAIVKRIIGVHGGRIWAESRGGGTGTTFCFTLPMPGGE